MVDNLRSGSILVVDDVPEHPRGLLGELADLVEIVHPDDISSNHLEKAHLVLVDHDLKSADWPTRANYPLACQPLDGVALGHLLLGHFRSSEFSHSPPTAVGVLSAQLDIITPGFDDVPEHIAARTSGLHWAFWKTPRSVDADEQPLTKRIQTLAESVMSLPDNWKEGKHLAHLWLLLGLDNSDVASWAHVGLNHALRSRPPLHELATWTSGLSVIRWLAQRVLPYPTFLLGLDSLAVRLGVMPNWFREQMKLGMPLEKLFQESEYRGILHGFLGRRWWIAGIDEQLQNAGPDVAFNRKKLAEMLKSEAKSDPALLPSDHTLVLDNRLVTSSATAPFSECVRLQLDDWPSFAEEPWTTIKLAQQSNRLRASVHFDDEERLANE